jgi:hypothetical protein
LLRYLRLRSLNVSRTVWSRWRDEHRGLAEAIELRERRLPLVALVESHLLARTPSEAMSERLGLSAATIDAYHDACFDVRDRLDRPDLIISTAIIGPQLGRTAQGRTDAALKLLGYLAGDDALVKLITPTRAGSGDLAGFTLSLVGGADALLEVEQYLAVLSRDAGAAGAVGHMLTQSIGRRAREKRPEPLNFVENQLKGLLDDFPWHVGPPGPDDVPCGLTIADSYAAELRDDELHRLAAGGPLSNLEEIAGLQLPPARSRPNAKPGGARDV